MMLFLKGVINMFYIQERASQLIKYILNFFEIDS